MLDTQSDVGADSVLERLLVDRWSCRAFLPESVPRATIDRMFTIAQRAPSWCNTQPWGLYVSTGTETARLRQVLVEYGRSGAESQPDYAMPPPYTGVHRERRRRSGWQLYEAVGVQKGDREASARQSFKNYELFGAPHVAVVTVPTSFGTYGAVDAGIYVGALLLAAQSLGLAAIPQAALAHFAPVLREFFDIPADRSVLLGVSFGYPDIDHPANSYRTERADLKEVVMYQDARSKRKTG